MNQKQIPKTEHETHYGKLPINHTTKFEDPKGDIQLKPQPQPVAEPTMDTSFQENLSDEHAQAIWTSSIQFLKNSLKTNFDETKGFNDGNTFEFHMEHKDSIIEDIEPFELLNKNQILTFEQKKRFVAMMKKSTHLKKLIQQLYCMFADEIYEEMVMILYQSISNYRYLKQSTKLNIQFAQLWAPSYSNLDLDTIEIKSPTDRFCFLSEPQIVSKADEAGEQIAGSYFKNTKIRYLNLSEVDVPLNNSNIVRSQFSKFVQVITQAVYLCVEGCFLNPNELTLARNQSQDISMEDRTPSEMSEKVECGRKRRNL